MVGTEMDEMHVYIVGRLIIDVWTEYRFNPWHVVTHLGPLL